MKNTIKALLLLLIVLGTSCKKDFEATQKKTLLLTKPVGWLTVKVEEKGTNGNWTDVTNTLTPFEIDNRLIFDPFGAWAIDEGPIKFPGNPQINASGIWLFLEDGKKIQIVNGNLMEIEELTESKLQTLVPGTITRRYTFGH